LQEILHCLLKSTQAFCETTSFCACWEGWDNKPINTREQQDANEFLQLLLDHFPPPLQELFRGQFVNCIRGMEDGQIYCEIPESFFSLGMAIKNTGNLAAALETFSGSEDLVGDNQYEIGAGVKVPATKQQKLTVVPPVLIFHLKRFEYSTQTQQRRKLNLRFEFGETLEVSVEGQPGGNYQLHGAVIHTGEALAGHYTSVIKLNGKWIKFNDTDVSEISEAQFQREAFGGEGRSSAYLLFYIDRNAIIDGHAIFGNFPLHFSDEIVGIISQHDALSNVEQCAYSPALANVIVQSGSFAQIRDYYFQVFSHSRMSDLAKSFIPWFEKADDGFLDWLIANLQTKVIPIFMNCTVSQILDCSTAIVQAPFTKATPERAFVFADSLLAAVPPFAARPRQIGHLFKVVHGFLARGDAHTALARAKHWVLLICDFLRACFSQPRHQALLESLDFTSLFNSLTLLLTDTDGDSAQAIPALHTQLSRSRAHFPALKTLLMRGTELRLYDATAIAKLIPSEFSPTVLLESRIRELHADNFVATLNNLMADRSTSSAAILEALIRHEPELRTSLIAHVDFVIRWVNDVNRSFAESAESLVRILFPRDGERVFAVMRTQLAVGRVRPLFLRLLLWMLVQRKHPRVDALDGLERQAQSDDLACVLAYFGDGARLITALGAKLSGVNFAAAALERLAPFMPALAAAPDAVIEALLASPTWGDLSTLLTRASGEAEYAGVEHVVKLLIERQTVSRAPRALLRLLLGESGLYVCRFVRYVESVARITEEDMGLLNGGIAAALSQPCGMEQPLEVIVPRMLGFFARRGEVAFALPRAALVEAAAQRVPRAVGARLLQYAVALARANRVFLGDLREAIRKERFDRRRTGVVVTCLMVALWDRLAVVAHERDEGVLADFRIGHAQFEVLCADGFADEVWRAYREWVPGRERGLEFAVELFFRATLVCVAER
jgi:hypothetical protein